METDYKKLYENAINKIKSIIAEKKSQGLTNCLFEGDLNEIFPELKESEDEQIRKEIIKFLIDVNNGAFTKSELKIASCIAWLEKQGEKSTIIDVDKMVKEYSQTRDGNFELPMNCMIRAYRKGINDVLRLSLNLEKQGEQKPAENIKEEWIPQSGDRIRKRGTTEPIYMLCSKTDTGFRFVEERKVGIAGGELSIWSLNDYELVERPKTIEEAVNELFKPLMEVTKEQKPADKSDSILNILNKENRKVQQEDLIKKPSLITVGENEVVLSEVISILDNGFMPSSMERARLVKGLQSIKLQSIPAWSEEGESNINDIRSLIYENCDAENASRLIEWLMSLKPQPKQEWSEEDEKMLGKCIDAASGYYSPQDKESMKNWLKSLKPQSTWKPTEEQISILYWILTNIQLEINDENTIESLYCDLKKL